LRRAQAVAICLTVAMLVGCQLSPISLSTIPSRIERIEGHASLTISGDQGSARSKFSFLFQVPSRGRIDVTGALGSVLYRIIIHDGDAYFVLPSKKAYWQGKEEDIIDKFMGFRLSLDEMINLLSGTWEREDVLRGENLGDWAFTRDKKGRVVSGKRQDLRFAIEEFIGDTAFARRLVFEHPSSTGQVKILNINLNGPIGENVFSKKFLTKYQPKTWAEIQEMLDHAR